MVKLTPANRTTNRTTIMRQTEKCSIHAASRRRFDGGYRNQTWRVGMKRQEKSGRDAPYQGGGVGGGPLESGANAVQATSYTWENKGFSSHAHAAYGVSREAIRAAVYEVMSRRCECITCGNLKGKRVGDGYLVECGPLDWWRVYPVEEMTPQVLEGIGRRRVRGCRLYDGGDGGE